MTASKSSPKGTRLTLWRNTIQLFHQYNRPPFIGPFKKAGFDYRIEPIFLTGNGEERKPDIIASARSGWFVMELTFNEASKEKKLREYARIEPRYLGQYGLHIHTRQADVLSSRLSRVEDGPFCQLFVADKLAVLKEQHLSNEDLRRALVESRDVDLQYLPSLPFTLLPEMNAQEVREGLVDMVLQIFAPDSAGVRAADMVEKGLERLADLITPHDKSTLVAKVDAQMKGLANLLEGYLEQASGVFRASAKWKEHPKTREYVIGKLKTWIAQPSSLADFT